MALYEAALLGRNTTDKVVTVGAIDFNDPTGFINEMPREVHSEAGGPMASTRACGLRPHFRNPAAAPQPE